MAGLPYLAARSGVSFPGGAGTSVGWSTSGTSLGAPVAGDLAIRVIVAQRMSAGAALGAPTAKKDGVGSGDWTMLEGAALPLAFGLEAHVSIWARVLDGSEGAHIYIWDYGVAGLDYLYADDYWRNVDGASPIGGTVGRANAAPAQGDDGLPSTDRGSLILSYVVMEGFRSRDFECEDPGDFEFVYGFGSNHTIDLETGFKVTTGPTGAHHENGYTGAVSYNSFSALIELISSERVLLGEYPGVAGLAPPALGTGGSVAADAVLTGGPGVAPPALIGGGTVVADEALAGGDGIAEPALGSGSVREVTAGSTDPTVYAPGSIGEQEAQQAQQDAANEEGIDVGSAFPVSSSGRPELELFVYYPDAAESERRLFQYSDLKVVHPLNDSRTLSVKAPIFDTVAVGESNVSYFRESGYTWIKALYRGRLIFNGPILEPDFHFGDGHVDVTAHDPTIFLKNHFVHSWDVPLLRDNGKLPVSGASMWKIVQAAYYGELTETHARTPGFTRGHITSLDPIANSYVEVQEGMNLWELLLEMSGRADGPDFDFKPIDRLRPGMGWEFYGDTGQDAAEFRAYLTVSGDDGEFDGIGRDLTDTVVFHYGWGRGNLKDFRYKPNAEAMRTRATAAPDKGKKETGYELSDEEAYGIWEAYESPGEGYHNQASRRLWIRKQIQAYSRPLEVFEIEPHWDQGLMGSAFATPWRYPTGYRPGDTIRAIAKKGNDGGEVFRVDVQGRITQVTLEQMNAVENVKATLELIPEAHRSSGGVNFLDA